MKAVETNGAIEIYSSVPKSWGRVLAGFDLLSDSDLEGYGFYDVVMPSYNPNTQILGDIYFDSDNNQFTYPVSSKTWSESVSELKIKRIEELKSLAYHTLSQTDWYVVRKSEKGVAIPSDIQTQRDNIRTSVETKESEINAKTTKASVMGYDISL